MIQPLDICPFCGGHAHIHRCFLEELFYVSCDVCGNRTHFCNNPKLARKAWNKRFYVH